MQPKTISLLLICLFSSPLFAQINFEKGYFITNDNQVIRCQIKNTDWEFNPETFKYRMSDSSEVLESKMSDVREFGIDGFSKFVRRMVYIDRSPMDVDKLSMKFEPEWKQQEVYLQVLVEGNINLYFYSEYNFRRFFYSSADSVAQLVFKEYKLNNSKVGYFAANNTFRNQLIVYVNFPKAQNLVKNIGYYKNELTRYFIKYNEYTGELTKVFNNKNSRDLFNLNISSGINSTSIQTNDKITDIRDTEFKSKISPRIALEAEFVLPFHRNKWSVILEPSYLSYSDSAKVFHGTNVIEYKVIDLSVIARHYFFLNNNLKIYGEACLNSFYNFDLNSTVKMPYMHDLSVKKNQVNLGFGAGVANKRFNVGLRYYAPQRIILEPYGTWVAELNKVSLVVGIKIID